MVALDNAKFTVALTFCLVLCPTLGFQPSFPTPLKANKKSISSSVLFTVDTVEKSAEQWQEELSPEAYYVLREDGTERPWTSELNDVKEEGTFTCAGCGSPLFRSKTKFESGSGWPSFFAPLDENAVSLSTDFKLILPRTEVRCAVCDGHLGHVFDDGPDPTGKRFCMNGVAMSFRPDQAEEGTAFLENVRQRETDVKAMKADLMSVLPTTLLFGGATFGYINTFVTQLKAAQAVNMAFPSSPLDVFPLVVGGICGYFATRNLLRVF